MLLSGIHPQMTDDDVRVSSLLISPIQYAALKCADNEFINYLIIQVETFGAVWLRLVFASARSIDFAAKAQMHVLDRIL